MTKKIAISLPDESLERARSAVRRGKAANVSNYIAQLLDEAGAHEPFEEMIADLIRQSGASEAQIRAADHESQKAFERAGLVGRGLAVKRGRAKRVDRTDAIAPGLVLESESG